MSTPQNLTEIRRRTGRIWWEFYRENDQGLNVRHEIKAAACVTKAWPKDSKLFEIEAAKWAATASQGVCTRLDYDESTEGKTAAAQLEYDQALVQAKQIEDRKAELIEKFPTIVTVSAEVSK